MAADLESFSSLLFESIETCGFSAKFEVVDHLYNSFLGACDSKSLLPGSSAHLVPTLLLCVGFSAENKRDDSILGIQVEIRWTI